MPLCTVCPEALTVPKPPTPLELKRMKLFFTLKKRLFGNSIDVPAYAPVSVAFDVVTGDSGTATSRSNRFPEESVVLPNKSPPPKRRFIVEFASSGFASATKPLAETE